MSVQQVLSLIVEDGLITAFHNTIRSDFAEFERGA
ncbi:hypothetical protein SAMN05421805_1013 [Saccharopolyspora antimicrobica]|uniref:Uncharacterized protein n=1 Tax=Saccharopolyspora antimicrobica TaxID=455193 RepID=A0A1I4Q7V7_9PSEU|nr:hypothetical protein ATL45_3141 [Saccharopolyspora antimicrobica]SFM36134.1 hypothetical protein SAMN05421805_1013 [Saccharopolyspora antimicrobica]